jgi:hypothetical protein
VGSEIAKQQNAGLGIKYESQLYSDAAFEQRVAKSTDAESRMQMWGAERVADVLPLPLRKLAEDSLQFGRQLNPQGRLRCRH